MLSNRNLSVLSVNPLQTRGAPSLFLPHCYCACCDVTKGKHTPYVPGKLPCRYLFHSLTPPPIATVKKKKEEDCLQVNSVTIASIGLFSTWGAIESFYFGRLYSSQWMRGHCSTVYKVMVFVCVFVLASLVWIERQLLGAWIIAPSAGGVREIGCVGFLPITCVFLIGR